MLNIQRSSVQESLLLEQRNTQSSPSRICGNFCLVSIDSLPINLTTPGVNINIADSEPTRLLPEITADEEEDNDWKG
jgi:hypothetical protein